MYLTSLELSGFKSFAKKSELEFSAPITAVVGPNGSGKSNIAEAFRFVLGEQSMKSLRGKKGEDLIFSGGAGGGRLNRASVKLVFDNTPKGGPEGKRLLNVDFDEVEIVRAVFRDGTNEYSINGSKVRLKDITELLAAANIGSSGHHIISQGEADRVLTASPKERRFMIEDALGLRVYHYKKAESERKLEKTEENKQQVVSLRKENAPHLKFLAGQVEKIRKAAQLREELSKVYRDYLKREELYLQFAEEDIAGERDEPERELKTVEKRLAQVKQTVEKLDEEAPQRSKILEIEQELSRVRDERGVAGRELGKLEGQIAAEERRIEEEKKRQQSDDEKPVPYAAVRELAESADAKAKKAQESEDVDLLRSTIATLQHMLADFLERHKPHARAEVDTSARDKLVKEKESCEQALEKLNEQEEELTRSYKTLQGELEAQKDESREAEREMFDLMTRRGALEQQLTLVRQREHQLARDREEFQRELAEAGALIGRDALAYKEHDVADSEGHTIALEDMAGEERDRQFERRRELERMKIRLEEMGGANADEIMKEYEEVKERDEFLGREIEDLEHSAESLQQLIRDLDEELASKFDAGVGKIGEEFKKFFTLMFGGGDAKLTVVEEKKKRGKFASMLLGDEEDDNDENGEEEDEGVPGVQGIDIEVQLPNKRIQGLLQLSGGERALTSIALIFAMSQVNPPPFLVLDETDAALDEANSRRYGDMIENLAKRSQLVLITHNRETMSRAGILYGVTMGADSVSKLLSVKFDEGVQFAKS